MVRILCSLASVLALSLVVSSDGFRLKRKVVSVSSHEEPDTQGHSKVQEEAYDEAYEEAYGELYDSQGVNASAPSNEDFEDHQQEVFSQYYAPSLIQDDVSLTNSASLGQSTSNPQNPQSFRFHGAIGKYAKCINGLWKATTSSRLPLRYKKSDNAKAQFRWMRTPSGSHWILNITGGPGACGRALGKSKWRVILKAGNYYNELKVTPFNHLRVKTSAGKFRSQRKLWFDGHSQPVVVCKDTGFKPSLGSWSHMAQDDCAVSHLKPRFDFNWRHSGYYGVGNNGREFKHFRNNFTLADRVCNKARPRRWLPRTINGKRVLVPIGKNRWRVDKANLKTNKTFLSYRTRTVWGMHGAFKPSGPKPGPTWGTIIRSVSNTSDYVEVEVRDESRICIARLWNYGSSQFYGH